MRRLFAPLLLALLAALLYAPTTGHGFVYDDEEYVVENPLLDEPATSTFLRRTLLESHSANWHPLTWWTHRVDRAAFGLEPAGHHLVNVIWFAASCVLFYLALCELTARPGPSLVCALLFTVHPLRVESVAWVAERKDLVSGFFFFASLYLHARFARHGGAWRYVALLGTSLLGLMAKPMLVTLPCVLLLLDAWPLRRTLSVKWTRLVLEKLPLFALSAGVSLLTIWAQSSSGAVSSVETIPLELRLVNALDALGFYLSRTLVPLGLAVIYPHPGLVEADPLAAIGPRAALSAAFLGAVSLLAWRMRRRTPELLVGWLWFLGMLVPVIGLVTVGAQAHADRYAYLPTIGLYVMVVFPLARLAAGSRELQRILPAAAALVVITDVVLTWRQVGIWSTPERLYEHAIATRANNYVALTNLGQYLADEQRPEEARARLEEAVGIRPDFVIPRLNLAQLERDSANPARALQHIEAALAIEPESFEAHACRALILRDLGDLRGALDSLDRALALDPSGLDPRFNRAVVLTRLERLDEARDQYEELLARAPEYVDARINLGNLFLRSGRPSEAVTQFQGAVSASPESPQAHAGLALALHVNGRTRESLGPFREALRLAPGMVEVAQRFAWILVTHPEQGVRSPKEGLALAQALRRTAGDGEPVVLETLAAALAANGAFDEAVVLQQQAVALFAAKGAGEPRQSVARDRLESYRARRPLRE